MFYKQALKIYENASPDKRNERNVAATLYSKGRLPTARRGILPGPRPSFCYNRYAAINR